MEEEIKKEKSIEKVNINRLRDSILGIAVESKLITEEGLRTQGTGIMIRKLENIEERIDRNNRLIALLTKDINRVMKHFNIDTFQK